MPGTPVKRKNTTQLLKRAALLFGRLSEKDDPREVLSRQKQECEKLIEKIRYCEEMQKQYSMEILMSMRLTPPAESCDDLAQEIREIDEISMLVYGMPARGRPPEQTHSINMKKINFEKLL